MRRERAKRAGGAGGRREDGGEGGGERAGLAAAADSSAPYVQAVVERSAGEVEAVGGEGDRIDGLAVLVEHVAAAPRLGVPQPDRRVE